MQPLARSRRQDIEGHVETTALGAAYLAGLVSGLHRGTEAPAAQWLAGRVFEPAMSRAKAGACMAQWARAVRQTVAS
jgi:glycerol kinase